MPCVKLLQYRQGECTAHSWVLHHSFFGQHHPFLGAGRCLGYRVGQSTAQPRQSSRRCLTSLAPPIGQMWRPCSPMPGASICSVSLAKPPLFTGEFLAHIHAHTNNLKACNASLAKAPPSAGGPRMHTYQYKHSAWCKYLRGLLGNAPALYRWASCTHACTHAQSSQLATPPWQSFHTLQVSLTCTHIHEYLSLPGASGCKACLARPPPSTGGSAWDARYQICKLEKLGPDLLLHTLRGYTHTWSVSQAWRKYLQHLPGKSSHPLQGSLLHACVHACMHICMHICTD